MPDKFKSIILVAHGSRRTESNEDVRGLTETLRARAGQRFHSVRYAFLELAAPSVQESIEASVGEGAREIVVIPYFLSPGRHVVKDLPKIVESIRNQHPEVVIVVTTHVGAAAGMQDLLLALVT